MYYDIFWGGGAIFFYQLELGAPFASPPKTTPRPRLKGRQLVCFQHLARNFSSSRGMGRFSVSLIAGGSNAASGLGDIAGSSLFRPLSKLTKRIALNSLISSKVKKLSSFRSISPRTPASSNPDIESWPFSIA
jgi:hypothetical protein